MGYDKKEYDKKYREANRDSLNARMRELYYANIDEKKAKAKLARERDKDKNYAYKLKHRKENPELYAVAYYSRIFKISRELARELYHKTLGVCESCGDAYNSEKHTKRFCIDHDHETGDIRGILCGDCNVSLGKLRDDENRILGLYNYLRNYNGN